MLSITAKLMQLTLAELILRPEAPATGVRKQFRSDGGSSIKRKEFSQHKVTRNKNR